ncbi:MAG: hypothetical protein Ct9H300mP31_03940 [Acidimicrobiaceae bacterium]|nr:MAG: hypothetical protein Ct9H300mP31_03940 [Acidimicrobiaceae bacterium]
MILFVSTGPAVEEVPDLSNRPVLDAMNIVSKLGWQASTMEERSRTVPIGQVVRTEPPAHSELAPGSTLLIVVSSGLPLVPVPPVEGMRESTAVLALESIDLAVNVRYDPPTRLQPKRRAGHQPKPSRRFGNRSGYHGDHRGRASRGSGGGRRRGSVRLIRTGSGQETRVRKLASRSCPLAVKIDSGWNCTPSTSRSRWRSPMTRPSSLVAVISSSSGTDSRSTIREW